MKKAILVLFCFAMLVLAVSCDTKNKNGDLNAGTPDTPATDSNIPDAGTPCAHAFGEWSISKQVTEREDGEEIRACSHCGHYETKRIHAKGTEGLLFTLSSDGTSYSVSGGSATEGNVFIPAYHNGLPVTSIGYIGFAKNLEDDDHDEYLENFEIGQYAFLKCNNLKNVVIPSTVTVIGDAAFLACENLESIVIPESVEEIGEFAFHLSIYDIWSKYDYDDIRVAIPDSDVILILREWLSLFNSAVEIYYLDESGNEVLIADTHFFSDDTYTPFYYGGYEIINNNDATFTIRAGYVSDEEHWQEKTFDIPECVSVFVPKVEYTVTVFYGGNSREEWDARSIIKPGTRKGETNPLVYCYSETEPTEPNKFWHYVDGVPTVW